MKAKVNFDSVFYFSKGDLDTWEVGYALESVQGIIKYVSKL